MCSKRNIARRQYIIILFLLKSYCFHYYYHPNNMEDLNHMCQYHVAWFHLYILYQVMPFHFDQHTLLIVVSMGLADLVYEWNEFNFCLNVLVDFWTLPCFLHVTGHNCHGPTHQFAGHGMSLQCLVFSVGRVPSAFDQQFSSSTIPLSTKRFFSQNYVVVFEQFTVPLFSWIHIGSLRCFPPPHVAEHAAHSPSCQ